jgi:tetratricopeptide (TPR) repeat protein
MGNLPEARDAFRSALLVYEQLLGPDSQVVRNLARDLEMVEGELELHSEWRSAKRALSLARALRGPNHPDVARALSRLGLVYLAQYGLTEAVVYLRHALEIDEEALGSDHPTVATDLCNLGSAFEARGDRGAARQAYERALKILEQSSPLTDPEIASLHEKLQGSTEHP